MTNQGESADNLPLRGAGTSGTDTRPLGAGPVLVVAIGGLDPSGGAGVVRDLLTARTFGARVRVVPTAWTEQAPGTGVASVEPRAPARLEDAVASAWRAGARDGLPVAVKVGMLPDAQAAAAILAALGGAGSFAGPFVLDPVLGASSGGALFRDAPAALLPLAARATLVTPNVPEVAALLGLSASDIRTLDDVARAGRALLDAGARAVLVKGGHLPGGGPGNAGGGTFDAVDTLVTPAGVRSFAASRHPGPDVRGTGCALATAIAVGLGRGLSLEVAIGDAKDWLRGALEGAVRRGGEWHID
ncbi:MAG TPA: bifunctional hydroxymethylpyrimidine kinase/phosphomethylpyrimidine kinase [Polyangia bacterium]